MSDPTQAQPTPPFPEQEQEPPGREADMRPLADHGEDSYAGSGDREHCRALVDRAVGELGRLDVLVNNAGYQMAYESSWRSTNIMAMFHLCQAAVPRMEAARPSPQLLHHAATKGAISTFTKGLAQEVAERGIRVNAVAPGPIGTPLVTMSFPGDKNARFGADTPLGRPGQPAELAPLYVFLATEDSRYVSAEVIGATGGKPLH